MSDAVARLNAALEGRCYAIERELGEGGMATPLAFGTIQGEADEDTTFR